tara:strand:- start:105 stop:446 length:342 start_codon:yes stop_codon:yes gene_type:complete
MTLLDKDLLSSDLDFLISQTGKDFTGVSPAAIASKIFVGCLAVLEEGYELEVSGREVIIDSKLTINSSAYEDLPTKGAVLKDPAGTKYKVVQIHREDFSPSYVLTLSSQYARN